MASGVNKGVYPWLDVSWVDETHQSIATSATSTMQLYHNQDGSTIGNLSNQKKGLWSTENTSWGIHVKKMAWDAIGLISCMWIGPCAVRLRGGRNLSSSSKKHQRRRNLYQSDLQHRTSTIRAGSPMHQPSMHGETIAKLRPSVGNGSQHHTHKSSSHLPTRQPVLVDGRQRRDI